ncbi:hypothetical protein NL676_035153 [Syzygium grande]|nr:hypothetical protein NL676_035153 [Syzygium grande]
MSSRRSRQNGFTSVRSGSSPRAMQSNDEWHRQRRKGGATVRRVLLCLVDRDPRLSATVLIMKLPIDSEVDLYTKSLATSVAAARIRFVHLPRCRRTRQLDRLERAARGFVIDMFCTTMIELADEFGVPSYVFFTSSAAFLGLMLHLQSLQDEQHVDITKFKDSVAELDFPSFINPLPAKVLPSVVLTKEAVQPFMEHAKRIRAMKGIIINTFDELEPHALGSLAGLGAPAVYPVGPILNLKGRLKRRLTVAAEAMTSWSEGNGLRAGAERAPISVVPTATATKGQDEFRVTTPDPAEVLPEGFLDRTAAVGKVIGWAPQAAVLAHPAIGGFVSHCGWNSTLESIWFGVAVATWPLYAEQQFNAFELVVELGLAVEIKMDYRRDFRMESDFVVTAEEIEGGIRKLMEDVGGERRKKVKKERVSENHVIESNKPHVKRAVADLTDLASSTRWLSEFLLDMFCTTMIGLADELEVPSSVLFTSSTAFLRMMLYLQSLQLNSRAQPASRTSRVSQTCCQPRFYPPWF